MTANMVQAEFFHVGGENAGSLDALFEECGERVADGLELVLQGREARSGIKTVVRFFDVGSALTALALQAEALKKRDREVKERYQVQQACDVGGLISRAAE